MLKKSNVKYLEIDGVYGLCNKVKRKKNCFQVNFGYVVIFVMCDDVSAVAQL
jgi:hypothetical protein